MAGPEAGKYKGVASEELLDGALTSLTRVFDIEKDVLLKQIVFSRVVNWSNEPFTKGAYSYTTVNTKDAYEELAEPYEDAIFFAGEALFLGDSTATVESALASGKEVAERILRG